MQVGEKAKPENIAKVEHDEDCYFCKDEKQPIEPETNELEEHYKDDEPPEGDLKFKNDASKLGTALKKSGEPQTEKIVYLPDCRDYEVSTAAHHLIPGNGSLSKSELFLSNKYLWKDKKFKGNIGYNVNSSPNGVWLPGNYAQRPWGDEGVKFKANTGQDPKDYAIAAMKAFGCQFHDAHPDYNKFVKEVLNKIHRKLKSTIDLRCPKAAERKDTPPEECTPMYVLVTRLNTISKRMRRMLTTDWRVNVYTSRFGEEYMESIKKNKK